MLALMNALLLSSCVGEYFTYLKFSYASVALRSSIALEFCSGGVGLNLDFMLSQLCKITFFESW